MDRRLSAVPLAVLLMLLAASPAAAAQQFEVTTTADGAGSCPPIRAEQCTLREAVTRANLVENAGSRIHVPAGTYTLTAALPTVTQSTAITGDGAATTTIDANGTGRVFSVSAEPKVLGLTGMTIANGSADARTPYGGNILVNNQAVLVAVGVRVTGGRAANGAGVALLGGSASLASSVVDNNVTTAAGGTGGGVLALATSATGDGTTLLMTDSTVAFNDAGTGAGVAVTGNANSATQLERVTVADNDATGSAGGGLYASEAMAKFTVKSSVVARNTGNISQLAVVIGPSNCSLAKPVDSGQNVESAADCGFTTGSQNADPGLADQLSTVNGTYVLPLLAGSPAIDRAVDCGTGTKDQAGTARPVGAACDSGAFEYVPPIEPEPTPTPSPQPQPQPTVSPAPTATPAPTAAPAPTPVFNKSVVVGQVSGTILVRSPGGSTFNRLPAVQSIKLGSTVDARKGVVTLTSVPKAGGTPETAKFYDGMFKVTQSGGMTTLTLNEPLAPCASGRAARAAAKKPKTRKLWGDGKGRFRTKGQYSAATVRGTKWLVQDGCRYTLTRVANGVVGVRDEVKKRTIILRKGKRYTARPRR